MLLNTLVVAAVLSLAASAQGCAVPLCCDQVIYEPPTPITSTADSLGVTWLTYPIGVDCVPTTNPPADYVLFW